jgi:iron complex outermembrane receptor protein
MRQRDSYRFASNVASSIDLYAPSYGAPIPTLVPRLSTLHKMEQTGLYLQDQMRYERLVVTVGGRFDRSRSTTLDRFTGGEVRRDDSAFSGRIGVNYVFDGGIAPYASYATSFEPLSGTDFRGQPFEPLTGQQYEIGIKYQPPGRDTIVTLAAYHITQQNSLTPDPDPTHAGFNVQTGEVEARGISLEGRTRIGRNVSLIAAYAYGEAEVTKANPNAAGVSLQGLPIARTPRHMASLWADYRFDEGIASGLTVGGGIRYTGANYADAAATIRLASQTQLDAAIHYDFGEVDPELAGFRLSLTATNLTDERDINYCLNALQCFYGQGRTVLVTLRKQW